jgi:hypothetical protein
MPWFPRLRWSILLDFLTTIEMNKTIMMASASYSKSHLDERGKQNPTLHIFNGF